MPPGLSGPPSPTTVVESPPLPPWLRSPPPLPPVERGAVTLTGVVTPPVVGTTATGPRPGIVSGFVAVSPATPPREPEKGEVPVRLFRVAGAVSVSEPPLAVSSALRTDGHWFQPSIGAASAPAPRMATTRPAATLPANRRSRSATRRAERSLRLLSCRFVILKAPYGDCIGSYVLKDERP